jgi:hypothetical protein
MHQLQLICELLGYPDDWKEVHMTGNKAIVKELDKLQHCRSRNLHKLLPEASSTALELIYKMLHWDPLVFP